MTVKLKDRDGVFYAMGTLTLPSGVKVQIRQTTGFGTGQKAMAQQRLAGIIQEKMREDAAPKVGGKPEITVEEAVRKYSLSKTLGVSSTDKAYLRRFEARFGGRNVSALNKVEIREWAESGGPKKTSAVRRILVCVMACLNYAREYGYHVPEELKVKKPSDGPGRDRWLNEAERDRLIGEFRGVYWEVALMLFFTGARIGEVLKLTFDDVTPDGVVYSSRKGLTGERLKKRTVPLHDGLREIVEARMETSKRLGKKLVFVSEDARAKRMKYRLFLAHWQQACKAAGIADFVPHDARHTFATLLAKTGEVDLQELADLLGHADLNMVSRYRHLIPARQKVGINTLGVICTKNAQSPVVVGKVADKSMKWLAISGRA